MTTSCKIEVVVFPRWIIYSGWTQTVPSWWVKK